ncbi:MAG: hypothetical protein KA138_15595 [Saprospiraceae bacterium]|nr:hypothetical protein [Lewinellaceae bacterium]MBP6812952.1 hypothetical protein [Saprospiraceae bacterium]
MSNFTPLSFLRKIATGRNVLLLFALFIAFTGFIMPSLEADIKALSGGVGVIDLEFFYTPAKAHSMLSAYGPEGIHLYLIAQWTVDLVFPVIGGLFFVTCLTWLGARRWWWLGALLTLADWTENIFVTILLMQFPDFSPSIAVISCVFTCLKWATIFFSNGLILFHGGKKLLASSRIKMEQSSSLL